MGFIDVYLSYRGVPVTESVNPMNKHSVLEVKE